MAEVEIAAGSQVKRGRGRPPGKSKPNIMKKEGGDDSRLGFGANPPIPVSPDVIPHPSTIVETEIVTGTQVKKRRGRPPGKSSKMIVDGDNRHLGGGAKPPVPVSPSLGPHPSTMAEVVIVTGIQAARGRGRPPGKSKPKPKLTEWGGEKPFAVEKGEVDESKAEMVVAGESPKGEAVVLPKKRGRKPKSQIEDGKAEMVVAGESPKGEAVVTLKKRGRKPKTQIEDRKESVAIDGLGGWKGLGQCSRDCKEGVCENASEKTLTCHQCTGGSCPSQIPTRGLQRKKKGQANGGVRPRKIVGKTMSQNICQKQCQSIIDTNEVIKTVFQSEGQSQQQASNQPVDKTREALNIVDQMVEEGLLSVGDKLWGFAVFECQKETFLSTFLLLGCNEKRMHFIEYAFADKKGEV